jgi:hypothetical protein
MRILLAKPVLAPGFWPFVTPNLALAFAANLRTSKVTKRPFQTTSAQHRHYMYSTAILICPFFSSFLSFLAEYSAVLPVPNFCCLPKQENPLSLNH